MTDERIARLLPLIAVRTSYPIEQIDACTTLDALEFDSLALADILIGAEDAFGVDVIDADIEKLNTVGDLADLIASQIIC